MESGIYCFDLTPSKLELLLISCRNESYFNLFSDEKYSKTAQVQFVNDFALQNLKSIGDELEEKLKQFSFEKLKSVDALNILVDTNQKDLGIEIQKSLDR